MRIKPPSSLRVNVHRFIEHNIISHGHMVLFFGDVNVSNNVTATRILLLLYRHHRCQTDKTHYVGCLFPFYYHIDILLLLLLLLYIIRKTEDSICITIIIVIIVFYCGRLVATRLVLERKSFATL